MSTTKQSTSGDACTPGNASVLAGISSEHNGWYSRGYLPHVDQPNLFQSVTFRLYDSVPSEVVQRWKEELSWRDALPNDEAAATLRRHIVTYEDAGHGACWLRDERIAALVQNALLHFDGQRYRLLAWCIMPNHVHVLIETYPGYPLDRILHSRKSFASHAANKLLARDGPFWAREYYDRYIRDDQHLMQTVSYIEQNPVKAGFVKDADEWQFSSSYKQK